MNKLDKKYDRVEVIELLKPFLESQDFILAVWEAGSAATGYLDDVSDLDVSIIVQDDKVEETFQQLHTFLSTQFGILSHYRVPEPTWHGFSQTFYQINHVHEFFYLDIGVIKASLPNKFMETDRHGVAKVWFEKQPLYYPSLSPVDDIKNRVIKVVKGALAVEFVLRIEWMKALHRQSIIDSYTTGLGYLQRVGAPILNAIYRPAKVDFGLRYAYRDYPSNVVHLIESYLRAPSRQVQHQIAHQLLAIIDGLKVEIQQTIE